MRLNRSSGATAAYEILNCIVAGNRSAGSGTQLRASGAGLHALISHTDPEGGLHAFLIEGGATVEDGGANLDAEPRFVGPGVGTWSAPPSAEADDGQTTFMDNRAGWADGSLAGRLLSPNADDNLMYCILTNTRTSVTVMGVVTNATAGTTYRIHNFALQDGSPCVDRGTARGAPPVDIQGIVRPLGRGYDMGAYEYNPLFFRGVSSGTVLTIR